MGTPSAVVAFKLASFLGESASAAKMLQDVGAVMDEFEIQPYCPVKKGHCACL